MTAKAMTDLLASVDQARRALLDGEYAALARLAERQDALLEQLDPDACDPQDMAALQAGVARNESLLSAAREAFQAASADAQAVRDKVRRLETYGPEGNRRSLDAAGPSSIRRA